MDHKWTQATSRRNGNAPNLHMRGHEFECYAGRFKPNFCFSFYFSPVWFKIWYLPISTHIYLIFAYNLTYKTIFLALLFLKPIPTTVLGIYVYIFAQISTCTQIYMHMSISLLIFQKTGFKWFLASLIWSEHLAWPMV